MGIIKTLPNGAKVEVIKAHYSFVKTKKGMKKILIREYNRIIRK